MIFLTGIVRALHVGTGISHLLLPVLLILATFFLTISHSWAAENASELEKLAPSIFSASTGDLPEMKRRGFIRALVTFNKTEFFIDRGRPMGFQAEYLKEYEKFLNRGLRKGEKKIHIIFIPVPFDRMIPDLLAGKGDIAAAFLTVTPKREKKVAFAKWQGLKMDELLVFSKDAEEINSLPDLSGHSLYLLKQSSYIEHVMDLNRMLLSHGRLPVFIKRSDPNLSTEDILEMVNAGVVKITVADHIKAKLWKQVLPNIVVRDELKLHSQGDVGWGVRKANPELLKSLQAFHARMSKGTLFGNLMLKRYYENTKWIKNPFTQQEQAKFSRFVPIFKKYGERYGFDYLAIAAQAYQESRFDPKKRSPKGAVGVMQVMPSTASDPNVKIGNIYRVENNIHAGVKYLAFLRDRYFSDPGISPEDRLAFSWAAYNAGPGAVMRMREKAKKMGLDPNKWFQNVEYAALRIVGREPVRYVANIYKYYIAYKLIHQMETETEKRRFRTARTALTTLEKRADCTT